MENNTLFKPLKILGLTLLDLLTIMLVFSVWALINMPLFRWAVLGIFIPLLALNLLIYKSDSLVDSYGIPSFLSFLTSSFALYLLMMIFTGITYAFIKPREYIMYTLFFYLIYIVIFSGLYISGLNSRRQKEDQYFERVDVQQINELIISVENHLNQLEKNEKVQSWLNLFDIMVERFNASTPVGRIQSQSIIEQEKHIVDQLSGLCKELQNYSLQVEDNYGAIHIEETIKQITKLILNKEKMIVNKI
ncbi:hypothetical protein [Fusibacter sp. 3D3]|uniref:hypothetical protein n=1 Tax=Fusibacter sp. 3D3 TaxID=1048380 RepID=UPI000852CD7B|nr:hypothetical protein [Fusibacter sp. 3D3]GAU76256.1 hypothetical protein F3D3_0853 [Fusibacter sp. 3D3]